MCGCQDDNFCGSMAMMQVGEAVSKYDDLYLKLDGKLYKADARDLTKMPVRYMAGEDGVLDAFIKVMTPRGGKVKNSGWAWTPGADLFQSATTPGALTDVAPDVIDDYVQKVAFAEAADEIFFLPNKTMVKVK